MIDPNASPPIDLNSGAAVAVDQPWVPPWLAQYAAPPVEQVASPEYSIPGTMVSPPPPPPPPPPPQQHIGVPGQPVTDEVPAGPLGQAPMGPPPGMIPDATSGAAPIDPHLQYLAAINAPPSIEAMQTPNEHAAAVASNAVLPLEDRAKTLDESTLSPIERADVLARMPPEQLAALSTMEQARKIHEESARQLAIAQAADEEQRRNFAMQQAATMHANAETDAIAKEASNIANTKIVTPHGVGFSILSMLGGALGGLAAKGAGLSANPFIEGLNRGIEQSIAQQKDEIQNRWKGLDVRKNLVAEQYQRSGDLYRAGEVVRIAHYDSQIKQAQIAAQDYDPNGTTAIAIAQQTQAIQVQRAAALQATNQTLLKNKLDLMKAQNEALTQQETSRHNKAGEGIDWAKVGIEKTKAAIEIDKNAQAKVDSQPIPMDLLAARHPGSPMPPANMFPQGMSEKQYGTWLESQNKGIESQGKQTENAQKLAAGQVRDINGNPALDDKGVPIQVEPKAAEHANTIRAKGQEAIDALAAARRLLASDPSTIDRNAWVKVKNDLQNAGQSLAGTLGEKTSPRAIEETLKLVGDDYDSYTKRYLNKGEGGVGVTQIDNEIDTLTRNLNTEVKTTTGVKTSAQFFDTSRPAPTAPRPEDAATKILSTNFAKVDPDTLDADDRAFQQIAQHRSLDNPALRAGLVNDHFSPVLNRALATGIAPSQQRVLDQLQAAVRGADDAARAQALDVLGAIAGANEEIGGKRASATGSDANVRAAAVAIIDEANASSLESAPGAR